MNRSVLYVLIAVLVVALGAVGFAYYDHKQRTLFEVGVGNQGISVQKN